MDRNARDTEIARQLEAQGQRWHVIPPDDAWREVTLAKGIAQGAVMWVHCACGKSEYPGAAELARRTGVDPETPLLALAMRMRCTACRTKRVRVTHRPFGNWD